MPDAETYPVVAVRDDASEALEWLGSKEKFWLARGTEQWMFKAVRRVSDGDDWAERVACDVAEALGLPHAHYELAQWGASPGVVTRRLHGDDVRLVHGNEVLAERAAVDGYARAAAVVGVARNTRYTPGLVLQTLDALAVGRPPTASLPPGAQWPAGIETGTEAFVGYLLLDALVTNTDRHDENWAVLEGPEGLALAPTFDHASGLGRELPDTKREAKLRATAAPHDVRAYLDRPQARFYDAEGARLTPLGAFQEAATLRPEAARAWLERLDILPPAAVRAMLERVPPDRLSSTGVEFSTRTVEITHEALVVLRDRLLARPRS